MRLELVIGPMFAGKSSTLQSIVRRREAVGMKVMVIKHSIDQRYLDVSGAVNDRVVNHDLQWVPAIASSELMPMLDSDDFRNADLVIVEEGQFFPDIVEFAIEAVEGRQKDLMVVGLDGDAHRKPFGRLLELVPLADEIHRLHALCKLCRDGTPARFTCAVSAEVAAATSGGKPNVGGADSYMPVCRRHFLEHNRPASTVLTK